MCCYDCNETSGTKVKAGGSILYIYIYNKNLLTLNQYPFNAEMSPGKYRGTLPANKQKKDKTQGNSYSIKETESDNKVTTIYRVFGNYKTKER